jgi:uncharacterized protein YqkB
MIIKENEIVTQDITTHAEAFKALCVLSIITNNRCFKNANMNITIGNGWMFRIIEMQTDENDCVESLIVCIYKTATDMYYFSITTNINSYEETIDYNLSDAKAVKPKQISKVQWEPA